MFFCCCLVLFIFVFVVVLIVFTWDCRLDFVCIFVLLFICVAVFAVRFHVFLLFVLFCCFVVFVVFRVWSSLGFYLLYVLYFFICDAVFAVQFHVFFVDWCCCFCFFRCVDCFSLVNFAWILHWVDMFLRFFPDVLLCSRFSFMFSLLFGVVVLVFFVVVVVFRV